LKKLSLKKVSFRKTDAGRIFYCCYAQTSRLDQSRVGPVDKSDLPWYILLVAEIAAYNLVYQFHNIWSITFLFDKSR